MAYGDGFDDSSSGLCVMPIFPQASAGTAGTKIIIEFEFEVSGVYFRENLTTTATNW